MPTPYGSRGGMAFGVEELRVLRRALALALHPTPASAEDVQDCLRLAESLDEAVHEGARLRAFLVADLARYRAALPGTAAGYLALLEEALGAGYRPNPDDLAGLRALRGSPVAAALLDRCQERAGQDVRARPASGTARRATRTGPTVPASRTRLLALPGGRSAATGSPADRYRAQEEAEGTAKGPARVLAVRPEKEPAVGLPVDAAKESVTALAVDAVKESVFALAVDAENESVTVRAVDAATATAGVLAVDAAQTPATVVSVDAVNAVEGPVKDPAVDAAKDPAREPARKPAQKPAERPERPERPAAPKPASPAAPKPTRPIPTPGEVFPRRKPAPPPASPPQQLAAG